MTIAGIDCTVERKNTRRLHLYVKPPDGEVLVTAPFLYTEREIISFVENKADWIRKHRDRFRAKPSQARMALDYVTGETLYFWGMPYGLTVVEDSKVRRGKLTLDPEPVFNADHKDLSRSDIVSYLSGKNRYDGSGGRGQTVLLMPSGSTHEQREHLVRKVYKKVLEREAERVLAYWSDRTGFQFSEWHSRYMKSRWGSLSVRDRRVCLNTRLAEKPEACLIYVALHEIAHVKEPNHGPRFKAILDRYMPDWRDAEKLLKS